MAGSSPARTPMMTAAPRPPAQAWGDDDGLVVAVGVGGGGQGADEHVGGAAGQGQQDGLGQEPCWRCQAGLGRSSFAGFGQDFFPAAAGFQAPQDQDAGRA
jgi:hypothetical protein